MDRRPGTNRVVRCARALTLAVAARAAFPGAGDGLNGLFSTAGPTVKVSPLVGTESVPTRFIYIFFFS